MTLRVSWIQIWVREANASPEFVVSCQHPFVREGFTLSKYTFENMYAERIFCQDLLPQLIAAVANLRSFCRGRSSISQRSANLLFLQIFLLNCMKTNKIRSRASEILQCRSATDLVYIRCRLWQSTGVELRARHTWDRNWITHRRVQHLSD